MVQKIRPTYTDMGNGELRKVNKMIYDNTLTVEGHHGNSVTFYETIQDAYDDME